MIKAGLRLGIVFIFSDFSTITTAGELVCNSPDGEYHHCVLLNADKLKVKVKYRADGECKKGDTWGVDGKGIWVEGCQATFRFKDATSIQGGGWKTILPSWMR